MPVTFIYYNSKPQLDTLWRGSDPCWASHPSHPAVLWSGCSLALFSVDYGNDEFQSLPKNNYLANNRLQNLEILISSSQNLGVSSSLYIHRHTHIMHAYSHTRLTHMYTYTMGSDQMDPTRKSTIKLLNEGVPVVAQGVKNPTQCPWRCRFNPWPCFVG